MMLHDSRRLPRSLLLLAISVSGAAYGLESEQLLSAMTKYTCFLQRWGDESLLIPEGYPLETIDLDDSGDASLVRVHNANRAFGSSTSATYFWLESEGGFAYVARSQSYGAMLFQNQQLDAKFSSPSKRTIIYGSTSCSVVSDLTAHEKANVDEIILRAVKEALPPPKIVEAAAFPTLYRGDLWTYALINNADLYRVVFTENNRGLPTNATAQLILDRVYRREIIKHIVK